MFQVSPLFTDLYQLSMAKAYWSSNKAESPAVFEVFFRKCPFGGEYAIFAGFDGLREILENFRFLDEDIDYLKSLEAFKASDEGFFQYLRKMDLRDVQIRSFEEGQLAFERVPLLQVSGPLAKLQLLESALLNVVNYATLVATYARRLRMVSEDRNLVEFGMRRAQGPNGAMTASRSSYLGGCNATSNVLAGKNFKIPVIGTMAHSFVQSFMKVREEDLLWGEVHIGKLLEQVKKEDGLETNEGELGAFLAYAKVFPNSALLLVDTYNSLRSGLPNALRVFKILKALGYRPTGIRLDSGDFVYLSQKARQMLDEAGLKEAQIFASNELSEEIIDSLQKQGAQIGGYGVGTHLVTCKDQPALGGVYKLVEIDSQPRLKRSDQTEKTSLPAAKEVYRLYGQDGKMLLDLLCTRNEKAPEPGMPLAAHHPFDRFKKAQVTPTRVERLLKTVFESGKWIDQSQLTEARERSLKLMKNLRSDVIRRHNPAPYKVSLSSELKQIFDELYQRESPDSELK